MRRPGDWNGHVRRQASSSLEEMREVFRRRRTGHELLIPQALAAIREAAARKVGLRPYRVQLAGALALVPGVHRRDGHRRGEDADRGPGHGAPGLERTSLSSHHRQRLPCRARRHLDGYPVPLLRRERRLCHRGDGSARAQERLFFRRRLYDQQGDRRGLPQGPALARRSAKGRAPPDRRAPGETVPDRGGAGHARHPHGHRGRGGQHPHRRGGHPSHHFPRGPQHACSSMHAAPPTGSRRLWSRAGTTRSTTGRRISSSTTPCGSASWTASVRRPGTFGGAAGNLELVHQALSAREFFRNDGEYVVIDGKVVIVDEFTGRQMPQRQWRGGLHQLIELKEGLAATPPSETLARLSFQRFFRFFSRLSGMTGTAREASQELWDIYQLNVVRIPENSAMPARRAHPRLHSRGPRSGGPRSSPKSSPCTPRAGRCSWEPAASNASEHLSQLLGTAGLRHQVLNAVRHQGRGGHRLAGGRAGRGDHRHEHGRPGTDIRLGAGGGRAWGGCTSSPPSATSRTGSTASFSGDAPGRETRAAPALS